jgi:hypothetical protein
MSHAKIELIPKTVEKPLNLCWSSQDATFKAVSFKLSHPSQSTGLVATPKTLLSLYTALLQLE